MCKKILLSRLIMLSVFAVAVGNGMGQSVFRVGTFCFVHGGVPPNQRPIYFNQTANEWRVKGAERDRLLNLGLNYMLACTFLDADDALAFMGDSLKDAPVPKDFKSTMTETPPIPPLYPQAYFMYLMSRNAVRYRIQSWNDSVTVGYQNMYNRHAARIDGVHSFLVLAEGCTNQLRMMAGINFMCNSTIVDSYVQPWYVPTPFTPFPCDSLTTYDVAKRLVSADHFMGGGYYLYTTTPYSGAPFQAQLDQLVPSMRDVSRGIRDAASSTKMWAILQTQESPDLGYRTPTQNEILCMVNLALANGAKGIVYYLWDPVTQALDPNAEE